MAARRAEEEAARAEAMAGVPAPRVPAKIELNFSKGKRSMPARERLETDEEVRDAALQGLPAVAREGLWPLIRFCPLRRRRSSDEGRVHFSLP